MNVAFRPALSWGNKKIRFTTQGVTHLSEGENINLLLWKMRAPLRVIMHIQSLSVEESAYYHTAGRDQLQITREE